jgi:glycosyltransferase involved in cell wall biosynthesis
MRRVIFIMPAMPGGGAERVVTILSEYLVDQDYSVTICLMNRNQVDYQLPVKVLVDTRYINKCTGIIKSARRFCDLRSMLKKNKDAVFISFFSMFNIYLLAAGLGLKRRIIVSERLDPAKSIPAKKWLIVCRNILYRKATKIVFQTPDAMAYFDEKVRMRGVIIYNPIKDGLPERYTAERRKVVVSFARLEPQKNYPLLIDAFSLFVFKHPEYRLSIYGKGSCEDLLANKVKQAGLEDKVTLHGFDPDVHEKIRDCAMFVLPSDYEGLSNAMLEAMGMGLPCICTDCPPGGAKLFINNGINGFLTPVGDAYQMFEAMDQLADDPDLAGRISREAEKIKTQLSKNIICGLWEQIIADQARGEVSRMMHWLTQYIDKHKSRFVHVLNYKICRILPDTVFLRLNYRIRFGTKLNLKNPATFNEKMQWMKLYDRKPEYSKLADKYEVKDYIAKKIGEKYVVPLYGVFGRYGEIDFSRLPAQFVLKPTHTSGDVFLCDDKSKVDYDQLKRTINQWLRRQYYWVNREWHYKNITPRIICEKYLTNRSDTELKDFKFMCFHGEVKYCIVCANRKSSGGLTMDYYDMNWQHLPIKHAWPNNDSLFDKPKHFAEMVGMAKTLAKDMPFIRVDLYDTEEQPYFGELTIFPGSGYGPFSPNTYDYMLGSWIHLDIRQDALPVQRRMR